MKIGFDNEKYLKMQSEHIRDRINQFDNKLYLEFGGKLFDDFHASRVLPGFAPDAKLRKAQSAVDFQTPDFSFGHITAIWCFTDVEGSMPFGSSCEQPAMHNRSAIYRQRNKFIRIFSALLFIFFLLSYRILIMCVMDVEPVVRFYIVLFPDVVDFVKQWI